MNRSAWLVFAGVAIGFGAGALIVWMFLIGDGEGEVPTVTVPAQPLANPTEAPPRDDEPALWSIVVRYWNRSWTPLVEEILVSADSSDASSIRVSCEVAKTDLSDIDAEILTWRDSELRQLSASMFQEMGRALDACSTGAWADFDDSRDVIAEYIERIEACPDEGVRC